MSENVESDYIENEDIVRKEEEERDTACSSFLRIVIIFGLITGLVTMLLYLDEIKVLLDLFISWVSKHPFEGSLMIIAVYVVCELIFVPGTIMSIGTGFAL